MEDNLKIEEYRTLLESMNNLCGKMPKVILLDYYDNNKYLYSLYFEAFNSIKGVCVLLSNGALISQAASVLRMAIEKVATIRVLETYKELQEEYIKHRKLMFEVKDKIKSEKIKLVKEHFKNKMDKDDNNNALKYLEYGWLKSINRDYGFDTLIQVSKIQEQDDAIKKWKDMLNYFIHGYVEFSNLCSSIDSAIVYSHALIQITAKLLDVLMCEFHNENGFEFVIDNVEYHELFSETYSDIYR